MMSCPIVQIFHVGVPWVQVLRTPHWNDLVSHFRWYVLVMLYTLISVVGTKALVL